MKDILRRLYLSPLGRPISALLALVGRVHRPFMVYGYRNRVTGEFLRHTRISSTATIADRAKLDIGDGCWVWHHSIIDSSNGVRIGEGCQIGAWVGIFTHSSHIAIRLLGSQYIHVNKEDRPGYVRQSVEIGEYTFVGAASLIFPGVTVGRGCLIAAGSVVSKDVPDFTIVAGNPAKPVGRTTTLDTKFFDDPAVQESYFDRSVIEKYINSKESATGDEGDGN